MTVKLFNAPASLMGELANGSAQQIGALIKSTADGQILGHMQETAALNETVVKVLSGAGRVGLKGPFAAAEIMMQGTAVFQNYQILQGIGTLKLMGAGTLALSGLGLGVSILSFVTLNRKLSTVQETLFGIEGELAEIALNVEEIRMDLMEKDFDRLRTECELLDDGFLLRNAEDQWQRSASELHHLQNVFFRRAQKLTPENVASATVREAMIEAFLLAGSSRVAARLACNEFDAAISASRHISAALNELTGKVGLASFLKLYLQKQDLSPTEACLAIERCQPDAKTAADAVRSREMAAATVPITISQIRTAGLKGREWIETARSNLDDPFIFLPTDARFK